MSTISDSDSKNYQIDQSVVSMKSEAIIGQRIRVDKRGDNEPWLLVADSTLEKIFRRFCDLFTGKTTHYLTVIKPQLYGYKKQR